MALEKLLEDVKKHLDGKDSVEVYAPERAEYRTGILDKAREYWKALEPKGAIERIYRLTSPGSYFLWKLPPELHEKLNDVLSYSLPIIARAGPAGIAAGLTYAVSEMMYGLKTKSLKRVVSGLVGAVTHIKKLPVTGKSERVTKEATVSLEKHLGFAGA